MTAQEKREKVIKGLQEAVDLLATETSLTIVDQWVVRDALALLKVQEPRVLTEEDFIDNPDADSDGFLPVWVEYRCDGEWAEYWDGTADEWSTADGIRSDGYRFWTSRPTDEQRKAVKWE